jgi:hypothetical protein
MKKTNGMNLTMNEIDNIGDIDDMDTIGTKG